MQKRDKKNDELTFFIPYAVCCDRLPAPPAGSGRRVGLSWGKRKVEEMIEVCGLTSSHLGPKQEGHGTCCEQRTQMS